MFTIYFLKLNGQYGRVWSKFNTKDAALEFLNEYGEHLGLYSARVYEGSFQKAYWCIRDRVFTH